MQRKTVCIRRVKSKEENFLWQKYIEGEDYLKIHL